MSGEWLVVSKKCSLRGGWPGRTEGSPGVHTLWVRKTSAIGTLDTILFNKAKQFQNSQFINSWWQVIHGGTGVPPVL